VTPTTVSTVLNNKPVIGTTEEDLRLDLLYPSRDIKNDYENSLAVVIQEGEQMRPDILSANFFASPNYYDMILKHNGISNPFSIDVGELYLAPELTFLLDNNAPSGRQVQSTESVRNQYINPEKTSVTDNRLAMIDAQRMEAMKKRAESSPSPGSLLPPNIADVGDREISVIGGKVYFGRDVTRGKAECAEPISKSEFLARLIKNRTSVPNSSANGTTNVLSPNTNSNGTNR
jgi:hypothetical protein